MDTKAKKPTKVVAHGKTKIDWVAARKEYLEDNMLSYADIAKKYGVSTTQVEKHGAKDGWATLRQQLGEKVIVQASAEIVDRNSEINERHAMAFRNLQQLVGTKLTIAYRQIERLVKEKGIDNMTIYDQGMISQQDMKFLTEAYLNAINGERVTAGIPTSVERKEVTGRNGKDLFIDDNYDDYLRLLANSLAALDEGTKPEDSSGDVRKSKSAGK